MGPVLGGHAGEPAQVSRARRAATPASPPTARLRPPLCSPHPERPSTGSKPSDTRSNTAFNRVPRRRLSVHCPLGQVLCPASLKGRVVPATAF